MKLLCNTSLHEDLSTIEHNEPLSNFETPDETAAYMQFVEKGIICKPFHSFVANAIARQSEKCRDLLISCGLHFGTVSFLQSALFYCVIRLTCRNPFVEQTIKQILRMGDKDEAKARYYAQQLGVVEKFDSLVAEAKTGGGEIKIVSFI